MANRRTGTGSRRAATKFRAFRLEKPHRVFGAADGEMTVNPGDATREDSQNQSTIRYLH